VEDAAVRRISALAGAISNLTLDTVEALQVSLEKLCVKIGLTRGGGSFLCMGKQGVAKTIPCPCAFHFRPFFTVSYYNK